MTVPLHDESGWAILLVAKFEGDQLVVLDERFARVVEEFGSADAADAGGDSLASRVGRPHRAHDLFLDEGEVVGIDAALERIRSPQAERVRPFVIVRAGDEDIGETGQLAPD